MNAADQLVVYDGDGNTLASVQLAPGNYASDAFILGFAGSFGYSLEIEAQTAPTFGGPNTFEWQEAAAATSPPAGSGTTDFNAAANWLVSNAVPAAGPAAASDADFNDGGLTYTVTGYGTVNDLSVKNDNVTFDGGLDVSNLLITSSSAAVTLSTGNYTLGAVSVAGSTSVTLADGATVTVGTPGTVVTNGTLTNDATLINSTLTNNGTVDGTGTYQQTGGSSENYGSFTQSTLQINGGLFTNNGLMTITGDLDVAKGAALQVNSSILVDGNFNVSGQNTIVGPLNVALNYYEGDDTTLGQGGTLTAGTIEVATGGHFTLDGGSASGGSFDLAGGTLELQSGGFDLPLNSSETGTLQIDAGTTLEVSGTASSGITVNFSRAPPAALTLDNPAGFGGIFGAVGAGNSIQFASSNVSFVSYAVGAGGIGTLTLDVDGTDTTLQFADGSAFNAGDFTPGPGPGGTRTSLGISCFAAGTRVLTPDGGKPVELLRVGDPVVTQDGAAAPIVWLGHRHVDCRASSRPSRGFAVRITAGAFGPGLPRRDLFLSPDHAVFVEDVLIPVKHLRNGTTVAQIEVDRVMYCHVELQRHELLLAEGLPTESFLDTGNRDSFAMVARRSDCIRILADRNATTLSSGKLLATRLWSSSGRRSTGRASNFACRQKTSVVRWHSVQSAWIRGCRGSTPACRSALHPKRL